MLPESDRIFFRPKWRRIVATLFCVAWAIMEWTSNQPFWGIMATGLTAYCLWNFFYKFEDFKEEPPSDHEKNDDEPTSNEKK